VHYYASTLSTCKPNIQRLKISALRNPAVAKTVTGISTFYIPPSEVLVPDQEQAQKLGLAYHTPGKNVIERSFGGF